ncbi:MAG: COG1361 S-layer family protein [Candidatus Aenigmatarchaeota archaeon]|nr:COG1361 S-layer family protein [Candidatus Aenigmarchaeota archaeon]
MKRFEIRIILAICFIIPFLSSVSLAFITSNLQIQLLRYEPFPAEPGGYVRIWLNIENTGLATAKNVEVQVMPEYPFFLDERENATRYFGEILAKDNVVIDYLIRIAPDAVEGKNNITIRFREKESEIWNEKKVEVYIKFSYPTISIENVRLIPTFIEPGKSATLSLMLKNMGESDLRNIIIKLDLTNQQIVMNNDVNEKIIKYMKGNESKEISFNILSYPNATCGFYKIPIFIKYYDYLGNEYLKEYFITFVIGEQPKLELNLEKSEVLKSGDYGNIEVRVINRGSCEVKLVKIILEENNNFNILSSSKNFYVGSISPDDYEIFDFKIFVKGNEKIVEIPLTLEYEDENKNQYSERRSLMLRLYSNEEISKLYSKGNNMNIIIFAIVLVIVIYFLYKRRKKNRK